MSSQIANNENSACVNVRNNELNATIHPVLDEEDYDVIKKLAVWAFCAYNISILIVEINNTPSVSISHFAKKLVQYNPSYMQLQVICIAAVLCAIALFAALHVVFRIEENYAKILSNKNREIQMLTDQLNACSSRIIYSNKAIMNNATSSKPATTIWKKMD